MVITPALALALAIQYSVSISIVLSAFIITVHQCRTKHSIVYVILRLILAETGIAAFIALITYCLKPCHYPYLGMYYNLSVVSTLSFVSTFNQFMSISLKTVLE